MLLIKDYELFMLKKHFINTFWIYLDDRDFSVSSIRLYFKKE